MHVMQMVSIISKEIGLSIYWTNLENFPGPYRLPIRHYEPKLDLSHLFSIFHNDLIIYLFSEN